MVNLNTFFAIWRLEPKVSVEADHPMFPTLAEVGGGPDRSQSGTNHDFTVLHRFRTHQKRTFLYFVFFINLNIQKWGLNWNLCFFWNFRNNLEKIEISKNNQFYWLFWRFFSPKFLISKNIFFEIWNFENQFSSRKIIIFLPDFFSSQGMIILLSKKNVSALSKYLKIERHGQTSPKHGIFPSFSQYQTLMIRTSVGRVQAENPDLRLSELIFEPYTRCTRWVAGFVSK